MPTATRTVTLSQAETDSLIERVREHGGYAIVRALPDGTIAALHDLMYTRAIYLDCNDHGWHTRFCFEDRQLATQRFNELQSCDDEPQGYIARRE